MPMQAYFVWVAFGSFGEQLMFVISYEGPKLFGYKWRDQGRAWTKHIHERRTRIKRHVTEADWKSAKVRRAVAALPAEIRPPQLPTIPEGQAS